MGVLVSAGSATFTNGGSIALSVIDYTTDISNIQQSLNTLNNNLSVLNNNILSLQASIELSVGAIGAFEPGSVAASSSQSKQELAKISQRLSDVVKNQNEITTALGSITFGLGGVAGATHNLTAVTQFGVADQILKNSFDKQATTEALVRSGLPVPVPPPIADTLAQTVQNATEVGLVSRTSGLVTGIITDSITWTTQTIGGWVAGSTAGSWISDQWKIFTGWIKNPFKTAKIADAEVSDADSKVKENTP